MTDTTDTPNLQRLWEARRQRSTGNHADLRRPVSTRIAQTAWPRTHSRSIFQILAGTAVTIVIVLVAAAAGAL